MISNLAGVSTSQGSCETNLKIYPCRLPPDLVDLKHEACRHLYRCLIGG